MKILLINIDSKITNIALEKISAWHKLQGYDVEIKDFNFLTGMFYNANDYESVWVSCIFQKNKEKALSCKLYHKKCYVGGSGVDIYGKLPQEIDNMRPKINIGFTTRGCIRKCSFCIVPQKEGHIYKEGDIYDIWDKESKEIVLLDNNILALPEQFFDISNQIIKEKLKVDFNQGLDFRLLNKNIIEQLFKLKHIHEIRFAFDDILYYDIVEKALQLLKENGLKDYKTRWYIYIGIKDTFDTVKKRMDLLKKYKQLAYVMRDEKVYDVEWCKMLSAWGNWRGGFKYDLDELFIKSERFKKWNNKIERIHQNEKIHLE